ncbi:hypothetical protein MTO96_026805 [Rhipicephalus appendiculatus]
MQRLTKPSKLPTTSTAPAVSPASCFAAVTTVPTLSQPGDVNNPTPTALGQPAAFLSCTHTPATSNAGSVCATPSLKATFQPTCVVTMPTTDSALSAAKMLEPVPVVTQTPAFVVTNASTVAPESQSRITASALQSAALAAIPTGSAPGLATVNAESPEKSVLKSGVPLVPTGLPTTILADDTPTEMDFAASQGNDDDASHPEGSWTTISANRKTCLDRTSPHRAHHHRNSTSTRDTNAQTASVRLACFHHRRRKSLAQNQGRGHPSGQTSSEPCVSENALPTHCPPPTLSNESGT